MWETTHWHLTRRRDWDSNRNSKPVTLSSFVFRVSPKFSPERAVTWEDTGTLSVRTPWDNLLLYEPRLNSIRSVGSTLGHCIRGLVSGKKYSYSSHFRSSRWVDRKSEYSIWLIPTKFGDSKPHWTMCRNNSVIYWQSECHSSILYPSIKFELSEIIVQEKVTIKRFTKMVFLQ